MTKEQIINSQKIKSIIRSSILWELVNTQALRKKLVIEQCELSTIFWSSSYIEGEKIYVPFNLVVKSIMTRNSLDSMITPYENYYLRNPNINYTKGPKKGGHLISNEDIIIKEETIRFWYEIELSKLYFDIENELLNL